MIRNLSSSSTFIKNTRASSYDPLGLFSLAYTISQLTHSIFTLWSPPSCACTLWGAKNKGGSVYSAHPSLRSSTVSLPSTSPPITPPLPLPSPKKNQADDCCIKKLGEWEKVTTGTEEMPVCWLKKLRKLSGKLSHSFFGKCICSSGAWHVYPSQNGY